MPDQFVTDVAINIFPDLDAKRDMQRVAERVVSLVAHPTIRFGGYFMILPCPDWHCSCRRRSDR